MTEGSLLTRRAFAKGMAAYGAAAVISPALPRQTFAREAFVLGEATVETLSDGHLVLPIDFQYGDAPREELEALLKAHDLPITVSEPDCNLTLLRDGGRIVLFDAGSGSRFVPSAGKMMHAFKEIGLDPSQVTHVVFTHAHPDHIWGILDDFDDVMFPDAELMISAAEWDYWWNPATIDTLPEARKPFAVGAKRSLEAIEDQVTRFHPGEEILPGVLALDTNGHTPGHMSFEIAKGGESVLVLGDAITHAYISFAHPEWPNGADHDTEKGIATRKLLLDKLALEQTRIIGFHLPYPGFGRVEKSGTAYRYVADTK
ncbi:MBL fold metallo-hydrolase [Rhizobiales bacterium]|uniref:MBL fold metallo-hydrolase n=1 Tax=Hongsoonwoonella zoysiae TaxID=2821844 RepID=UPI001560F42C|nr:MBL fold metallo-hydrolase [Hongsoonwoonella zoysiae]NRG19299.1 MBL fold metallo-hydrolase [Hongsoonwoonella zoysiae]